MGQTVPATVGLHACALSPLRCAAGFFQRGQNPDSDSHMALLQALLLLHLDGV